MNPCVLQGVGGWELKNTGRCQEQQVRVSTAKTSGRQNQDSHLLRASMRVYRVSNVNQNDTQRATRAPAKTDLTLVLVLLSQDPCLHAYYFRRILLWFL